MGLVLLSRDLMTTSRVEGAAARQHVAMKSVADADQAIAWCIEQPAALVIVDLTTSALDVASLVTGLTQLATPPAIVAFGPHVHDAMLAAAADAGCDEVLTRGQFFAHLDAIVARVAGPP